MYTLLWTGVLVPDFVARPIGDLGRAPEQDRPPADAASLPDRIPEPPVRVPRSLVAAAPAGGGSATFESDITVLRKRHLGIPVAGVDPKNLQDSFNQARSEGRRHDAIDILAPRGTPVVAVDDGPVKKLFTSKRGGLTVYQFDRDGIYCYYYAHLDRYADRLREELFLRRGDVIGFVGTTGDAPVNTPHLHFAITKLLPERHWWEGPAINPYPVLTGKR